MKKNLLLIASLLLFLVASTSALAADPLTCWFPPGWKKKTEQAKNIAASLTKSSGITVRPRIAKSYPEILEAFSKGDKALVYVGSFVQAIINARDLGTPLVQNINGKQFYSGVLVYQKGGDPQAILKNTPDKVAYAVGASSGESSAKAATHGKASIGTANHGATCGAVKAGKAKAGVVKNWWWEANHDKYPELAMYKIPEISMEKNPDNVLTASKSVSTETIAKIRKAAIDSKEAFGAPAMEPFDPANLQFSLDLMHKGNIDPKTYNW